MLHLMMLQISPHYFHSGCYFLLHLQFSPVEALSEMIWYPRLHIAAIVFDKKSDAFDLAR